MLLRKITSFVLLIFLLFTYGLGNFMVYALSPTDISNKVFFLDAQDTDNDGNSGNEPANDSQITTLIDKFNSNTGSQITSSKQPIYKTNSINSYPSLYFDGSNDLLDLKDNLEISVGTGYTEKSYAMIIKTSDDISTFQTIYDEATKEKGFAFQIENDHLYAGAFNTLNWTTTNRTIDLGAIQANEIYTIIFVYSDTGDFIKAYLNGELKGTLNSIELQNTHGACTFETSFNCNIYSTGGALAIGSTKNDILKLSDSSTSTGLEKDFFKGYIGEISSYNHALTTSEVDGLNDYLFVKWGFDNTAPVINSTNISDNQILPGGAHNIIFNYTDTESGATGIDTATANPYLEKWNSGTSAWENITASGLNAGTITTTSANYPTNNLDYGKYRINFNISDNAGNTSLNTERIFYIDKPELTISTGSINIGTLNDTSNTFGDTITVTVKTIGTRFKVILKKNENLKLGSGEIIPYYDGNLGMGYDKDDNGNLSDYNDDIIMQEAENINTDGNLNTYTYTLKMGAIIDKLQAAGNYEGKIDFGIDLDY